LRMWRITSLLLAMTAVAASIGFAQEAGKGGPLLPAGGYPDQTLFNITELTSWTWSNGFQGAQVNNQWNGESHWWNGTFPKGTIGVIYAQGILWGGFVHDGVSPE